MNNTLRLANTLNFVGWAILLVGLGAIVATLGGDIEFGPGGETHFTLGLGVPVVMCWGVLRGLSEVLRLMLPGPRPAPTKP